MRKITEVTDEQIAKLPVWAQEYIATLRRQREAAIRTLNDHVDQEKPTPFYYEDMSCTGEQCGPTTKRFYIDTVKLVCSFAGVNLSITALECRGRPPGIDLQWTGTDRLLDEVALIPSSFQCVRLVAKKDMR